MGTHTITQLVYGQVRVVGLHLAESTVGPCYMDHPLHLTPFKGSTVRALGPLAHASFLSHMPPSPGSLAFMAIFLLILSLLCLLYPRIFSKILPGHFSNCKTTPMTADTSEASSAQRIYQANIALHTSCVPFDAISTMHSFF